MIEVGLVGYGLGGRVFHAPLVDAVARLHLAAVASSRAEEVRRAWPGVSTAPDPAQLIENPAIELIVISTPNDSHFALARAALLADKHVVVDKPLTADAGEGRVLVELARERGRVLSVFHNRRWDGDFLTVRRLIGEGAVGTPMLYEARWDRFRLEQRAGWKDEARPGTGLLPDLGSHLLDQALLLFGLPEAVEADLIAQRVAGVVEDYFELTLHYGKMRAILSASTIVKTPRPRFAVHGTGGSFVKHGLDPQEDSMAAGMGPNDDGFGEDRPELFGTLTDADGGARRIATARGDYRCFYEGVADAILDGAPPPVDPMDAVTGLDLIALARRSAIEGRRLPVVESLGIQPS